MVCRYLGPAFNVKGAWDGDLVDVRDFPQGLQTSVLGRLQFKDSGATVTMDDGHLNLQWANGPMSVRLDDTSAWQANLTEDRMNLRARGSGLDDISWEASKEGSVGGLGDVKVDLNSDRDFGVSVAPALPEIAGVKLKALASSHGDGVYGRLQAQRKLLKGMDLTYSVENEEGDYDLANLAHAANIVGRLNDGALDVKLDSRGDEQRYNATYTHSLARLLGGDGSVAIGADDDGIYGTFANTAKVAKGLKAGYKFAGRSDMTGADPHFAHSVKLSSDLGSVKISQNQDELLKALVESDITRGSSRVQGKLGYSLNGGDPNFNFTISSDLAAALSKLDATGTAQIGIDEASGDGLYGHIAASRKLGKGFGLHYSSGGRLKDMEHSVRLSNDLGYAQVLKTGDAEPRLRLGYEFNA